MKEDYKVGTANAKASVSNDTSGGGVSACLYYCFCYLLCCSCCYKNSRVQDAKEQPLQDVFNLFSAYALLSDAVLVVEIDKQRSDHKIVHVNNPACRLTGYYSNEIIGKNPNIIIPEGIVAKRDEYSTRWEVKKQQNQAIFSQIPTKDDEIQSKQVMVTRSQMRTVFIKTKTGLQVSAYIRWNIFRHEKKFFAVTTLHEQKIVNHIDFKDVTFHITDTIPSTPHQRSSSAEGHANLSGNDLSQHEVLTKNGKTFVVDTSSLHLSPPTAVRAINSKKSLDHKVSVALQLSTPVLAINDIYITPPVSFGDFGDITKWTFQPDDVGNYKKRLYMSTIRSKITQILDREAKKSAFIPTLLTPSGVSLSNESMQQLKTQCLSAMYEGSKNERLIIKCLVDAPSAVPIPVMVRE